MMHYALSSTKFSVAERGRPRAGDRQVIPDDLESFEQKASRLEISALCLSGGGIRSASFCLGVLQSLAESENDFSVFDYLSTVSGGGFIGGWLQLLIRGFRRGCSRSGSDRKEKPRGTAPPTRLYELFDPANGSTLHRHMDRCGVVFAKSYHQFGRFSRHCSCCSP